MGPPADEDRVNWKHYFAAVVRYRWAVLAFTLLGVGGGIAASRLVPPRYRAEATVWVEADARRGSPADRGPIRQDPMLSASAWTDLLRSYMVLDDVILETRLYLSVRAKADAPAFAQFAVKEQFRPGAYRLKIADDGKAFSLETADGTAVQRGTVGDSIGSSLGFRWVPAPSTLVPGRTVAFRVLAPRDAAVELTKGLDVVSDQLGTFLKIDLDGAEPEVTAATLNALTHRFVDVAAELKRKKLSELTTILADQLGVAQQHLKDAEIALEDFRVKTITLPSERASPVAPGLQETRDPVLTGYFEMKIERDQLRRDREAIDAALASAADSTGSLNGLALIQTVRQSTDMVKTLEDLNNKGAELRALTFRYTDQTPAVQRLRAELQILRTQTIPQQARALAASVRQRERELDDRIGSASKDLRQIPPRVIEEARLRRDVTIAENLYTTLQQRFEEARLAEASSIPDLRILDNAIAPERPTKNTAPQIILLTLFASIGLSLIGAVTLDRMDHRVRYPEHISVGLGLPILGSVPRANKGGGESDVRSVIEGFRGVRLSLSHAYGAAGPYLFTVTSPGPGDGKSFVSSNLALAFADAGYSTVLLDGDLRRGALHRLLMAQRKPGITDFLSGSVTIDRILQPTSHESLQFIGCGTWMEKAPELLGSSSMGTLLSTVRSRFSVVVVDSPPLGVGIDPLVWGTATGNMVVVMRTGVTNREMAAAKLEHLDRLPIRILGAVMNDVRSGVGGYGYYAYTPGYYVSDEKESGEVTTGRQLSQGAAS